MEHFDLTTSGAFWGGRQGAMKTLTMSNRRFADVNGQDIFYSTHYTIVYCSQSQDNGP